MRLNKYLLAFILLITSSFLQAQNYPVQSSLLLKGAPSPFVSDYVRVDDNPLMLTLVNSDGSFHGNVVYEIININFYISSKDQPRSLSEYMLSEPDLIMKAYFRKP